MHILQTGVNGEVGREQLLFLLEQGHTVLATDVVPLLPDIREKAEKSRSGSWKFQLLDCKDLAAIDAILEGAQPPIEGVIHYGAVSQPLGSNFRIVHNNNTVSSYNILESCASHGINRVVQASSINAPGMGFAPENHITHDRLPINEECPMRPEDPYSLSKAICELQAQALCRYYPDLRVASLRFHMVKRDRTAIRDFVTERKGDKATGFWGWTSMLEASRAGELGLTSEGWEGAETFYIIADDILTDDDHDTEAGLDLLVKNWDPLRYGVVDRKWWSKNPRRGFFDCEKAKRLLGWRHEEIPTKGMANGNSTVQTLIS